MAEQISASDTPLGSGIHTVDTSGFSLASSDLVEPAGQGRERGGGFDDRVR